MSSRLTELVKRPNVGTNGTPIKVRASHFEVTQLPDKTIHHYDVMVTPDVPSAVNRRVYQNFLTLYKEDLRGASPVYDGKKNLFSYVDLGFERKTFEFTLPQAGGQPGGISNNFKIKIAKAATINLAELHNFLEGTNAVSNNVRTAIQALDVLIHHEPSMLYRAFGRSFFTPEGCKPLDGKLDVWRGWFTSVRPAPGRMMINVDITASAFYQPLPVIQMAIKILGFRTPNDLSQATANNWHKVEKSIRGLRVRLLHAPHREGTIKGLTATSAMNTKFSKDVIQPDGTVTTQETNVAAYFNETYSRTLLYATTRCLIVRRMALPLELCTIVEGQRYGKKLDEFQTAEMIKFTTLNPTARANEIKKGLQLLNYKDSKFLKEFGMKISNEMAVVDARILPAPAICYHRLSKKEATFVPNEGAWNLRDKRVLHGKTLKSWGVLVWATERDISKPQVNNFVRELIQTCSDTGMTISSDDPPVRYVSPHGNIEQYLREQYIVTGNQFGNPELLVCVLPTTGAPLYAEIKRITDTVLGVASQCLQMRHVKMPKKQYCANVCLKINLKLGGSNSCLREDEVPFITDIPTILIGADVSHPPPGDTSRPSIAAMVASMDKITSRYATSIRAQQSRMETIVYFKDMVTELLKKFYQSTKRKPERILFYRDGVSENQFAEVVRYEIAALRAACAHLQTGYAPKITFVIVQKRHHTRFFPMRPQDADRTGNCKPGMVVDTGITHPIEFDFYLQSHAGLLGTSRSTHYHVIHDENRFTANGLQELSNKLCYLYARCTRSVSMVPPAYYAHLVAARARKHSKGEVWDSEESRSSTESVTEASYAPLKSELQNGMFFCT
ncbi:Eukaryotic translation initiation factor 2C [Podila verticillata]|nr:Eukaryotic translation initiation factor 2C [Podila verticillata]